MSLELSIRSRFGGSKVRSGCLTCKFVSIPNLSHHRLLTEVGVRRARHVKCDETKPRCNRCTRAGRNCEGYAPPNQGKRGLGSSLIIINYVAPSSMPSLLPT